MLIDGLEWCGLLEDYCDVFYQLFGSLTILTAPFTAEDPVVNIQYEQIFSDEETNLGCSAAVMPSKLEGAMDALITVFHNYSGSEGDKYKLSKGELKELLDSELTDFLTSQKDPMLVEKIMNDLDSNKDNEVDFNEFVVLVAALTVACNDFFQEQQKKKSKDEKKGK
ncbi:hypothetical protein cypCar_00017619 [Cyprinus carpio]|nr:hypothetical protein cypCar_00017619 [Cyprinus carpio]